MPTPEYQRKRRAANLEAYRERDRKYSALIRARVTARVKRWRRKNGHKVHAYLAVQYALRVGKLIKEPCEVCGSEKSQAHHDDYSKPLEVRWLCDQHHKTLHTL